MLAMHPISARNEASKVGIVLQNLRPAQVSADPLHGYTQFFACFVRVASETTDLATSGLKKLSYILTNRATGADEQNSLACTCQIWAIIIGECVGRYQEKDGGKCCREKGWTRCQSRII